MADIFISHATADKHIAEMLVDFLTDAVGVPEGSIFCSSLPGHGNPLTYDFNQNMQEQIQHPKLMVLLMTPAYMESPFCLMELGATWALQLRPLPIIVPPISFAEVTRTIGLKQGWNITNSDELESIRQTVLSTLGIEGRGNHNFNRKRARWGIDLAEALKKLAPAQKVTREEYDDALVAAFKHKSRADHFGEENEKLEEKLASLQRLKPVALLIEPEYLIAEGIKQILDKEGFVVSGVARTEKEALDLANLIRPDLVVAEIVLADASSGISAILKLQQGFDFYPLFVTAYPEKLLTERPEVSRLITKPFNPLNLQGEIRKSYSDLLERRAHKHRMSRPAVRD